MRILILTIFSLILCTACENAEYTASKFNQEEANTTTNAVKSHDFSVGNIYRHAGTEDLFEFYGAGTIEQPLFQGALNTRSIKDKHVNFTWEKETGTLYFFDDEGNTFYYTSDSWYVAE
ncbi:hypothetical protein [Flammeovirga aprica]|uniref:Uncharacterized protein n=1 Tax=Flammeovirga aprica JL-4 TaxID=694437 RepID=A0A7X9X9J5_9BACT|nr:hypothetical protein [Flammeovirga aprica]NME68848.1 hypothetical protein [Flammeovirga aprica JL-4]